MIRDKLIKARWVGAAIPEGEQEEVCMPWTTIEPPRILTAVDIAGDIYVISRTRGGITRETWKVML